MADEHHHFISPSSSYPPPTSTFDTMSMTLGESSHHLEHHSPPNSTSSPTMFGMTDHSPDHLDFSHATASPFAHHAHASSFSNGHQSSPHIDHTSQPMTLNPAQLTSNIGPSRVLTRRQARAAQQQAAEQDIGTNVHSQSLSGGMQTNQRVDNQSQASFWPTEMSRPQTPSSYAVGNTFSQQPDISIATPGLSVQQSMASPPHPSTPASTSSNFSHYGFHPYASHSRSTSSSTNPRSTSPAMSVMSVATSLSSSSSSRFPPPPCASGISPLDPRSKQKKQRLFNVDRKAICLFSQENPNARQEDIAMKWGVERSTISKILKHKTKWLSIPSGEELKVAKHRPSKFPQIEFRLQKWLAQCKEDSITITDSMIRTKAKETAYDMGIDEDKFKASAGWVENFKHRHGVRKGIWTDDGRNRRIAIALGCLRPPCEDEDTRPLLIPPSAEDFDSVLDPDEVHRGEMGPPSLDLRMDVDVGASGQIVPGQGNGLEPSPIPCTQWEQQQQEPHEQRHEQQHLAINSDGTYEMSLSTAQTSQDALPQPVTEGSKQVQDDIDQQVQPSTQTDHVTCDNDALPNAHAEHEPLSVQDMSHSHQEHIIHYNPHVVYQAVQATHAQDAYEHDRPVTAQDANNAIDKVLAYVKSQPEGYLSGEEQNLLTDIKQLLWLSAANLPDTRVAAARHTSGGSSRSWAS